MRKEKTIIVRIDEATYNLIMKQELSTSNLIRLLLSNYFKRHKKRILDGIN